MLYAYPNTVQKSHRTRVEAFRDNTISICGKSHHGSFSSASPFEGRLLFPERLNERIPHPRETEQPNADGKMIYEACQYESFCFHMMEPYSLHVI